MGQFRDSSRTTVAKSKKELSGMVGKNLNSRGIHNDQNSDGRSLLKPKNDANVGERAVPESSIVAWGNLFV